MTNFLKKFSVFEWFGVVIFLVFILHLPYLPNGFVWLDHGDIKETRGIVPLSQIGDAFIQPYAATGFYRPVVTVVNSIDYALYERWASGYHLTNVLLHMGVAVAAPFFLSLFVPLSLVEMLLVTFLVGVHPVSWLPVGAISYRPELLFVFFMFLTLWFHAKARKTNHKRHIFLTVTCFFLAVFSKETAFIILPLLIVFWEMLWRKKHHFSFKKSGYLFLFEIVILLFYGLSRIFAVPQLWKVKSWDVPFDEAIGTRLLAIFQLLGDLINPLKPKLSDAVEIVGLDRIEVWISTAFIGILGWVILRKKFSEPLSRLFFLLLLFLLPALSIIPVPRVGSPHYAYLPLVVFAGLIIVAMKYFTNKTKWVAYCIVFAWIVVACFTTVSGGYRFQNDITLFKPEVEVDPHFLEGYFYLGNYYLGTNEFQKADEAYRKVTLADSSYLAYSETDSALLNWAVVKAMRGDQKGAEVLFTQAEKGASENQRKLILFNRAVVASGKKDYKEVVRLLKKRGVADNNPHALLILADAYHSLGQDDEARKLLIKSLPLWGPEQRNKVEIMLKSIQGE